MSMVLLPILGLLVLLVFIWGLHSLSLKVDGIVWDLLHRKHVRRRMGVHRR